MWQDQHFEDDLELERQLKILNKPPIKTFVTKEGEIIDWIDRNKQPSLDHSLLKNHKIQRRPIFRIVNLPTSSSTSKLVTFGSRIPFPTGTVPIPGVRKEDLIRARCLLKHPSPIVGMDNDVPSHHLVPVKVADDVETKYGVDAHMSVYNLTVVKDQFSAHRLCIENGPSDHVSAIYVGWACDQADFYKGPFVMNLNPVGLSSLEWRWSHSTIYVPDGGWLSQWCFNILCPWFVQIHKTFTPNSLIKPTSTYGGQQYEIRIHVEQGSCDGNWWFIVHGDNAFGCWRKELFVNLRDGGKTMAWGGEGFSGKTKVCPPMGSGHMPDGKYDHAAVFRQVHYMTGSNTNKTPPAVYEHINKSKVYGLKNDMYIPKEGFGSSFTYGGPWGPCD